MADSIDTSMTDGVATVRLNRPEVHNALDRETLADLLAAVQGAVADPDTRVLVLAGGQQAFSTGDDLREAATSSAAQFAAHIDSFQRLTTILRQCEMPTIASVAGYAYGGGLEIAISCDARVAATNARFACPEVQWGLAPTNASSVLLRRLVGDGWARELVLFGRTLDASEAERIGLVTRVVETGEVDECAHALAEAAKQGSPQALTLTKRLLNRDDERWLGDVLAAEAAAVAHGFESDGTRARLQAFLDARSDA